MGAAESFGWVDRRCADFPVGRDRRNRKARRLDNTKMTRSVMDWLYHFRWLPWIITLSIVGIAVVPDLLTQGSFYVRPVVQMEGRLVGKTTDAARIHIFGSKLRGVECQYQGIQAFGDRVVGLPVDLMILRVDMPSEGITKPQGMFETGVGEVRPTTGGTAVRVYVMHNCEGHRVATRIAEVVL